MKHLANCTPKEFFTQTIKMRRVVENWLATTGMSEIRKRKPAGWDKMSSKEKAAAIEKQATENVGDMIWAAMEKDPDGTLEVMGLCTFSDAKADDAPPMSEYMESILEMFNNEAVRTFFTLCLKPESPASFEA